MADLVPNRECGPCKACCDAPLIDDPALAKLPGVVCPNYRDGCAIYADRPSTCRHWFCGWRRLDSLGEEWRPDCSGIMIVPANPERLEDGLQFQLIDGLDKIFWQPLVAAIAILIESGFPVCLAVPRGIGFHPLRAPLETNPALRAAIAANDYAAITGELSAAVQACLAAPAVKVEFQHPPKG